MATIEFYLGVNHGFFAVVESDAVPRSEEFVSIRKQTYRVCRVTWAVDDAATLSDSKIRACVEVVRYEG